MAESGIVALEFLNYKITRLAIDVKPYVKIVIENQAYIDWKFYHSFQQTLHDVGNDIYISQLALRVACFEIGDLKPLPSERDEAYVDIKGEITGIFKYHCEANLPNEQKDSLIRFQAPAILNPYLRAAVSGLLSFSGFPGAIFPLMNIFEMARQENLPINRINQPDENQSTGQASEATEKAADEAE